MARTTRTSKAGPLRTLVCAYPLCSKPFSVTDSRQKYCCDDCNQRNYHLNRQPPTRTRRKKVDKEAEKKPEPATWTLFDAVYYVTQLDEVMANNGRDKMDRVAELLDPDAIRSLLTLLRKLKEK